MKSELLFFLILGIIMLICIIIFIVYFVSSQQVNDEIENYKVRNENTSYNIFYNEKTKKFLLFDENNKNETHNVDTIIDKDDHHKLTKFINDFHQTKDLSNPFVVRHSLTNKLYKIEFNNYRNHVFSGKAIYVDENAIKNIKQSKEHFLDYDDFKKKFRSNTSKKVLVVYVVKFDLFQNILNRYGEEISEEYITKLYYLMERNAQRDNLYMTFFKDDSFLVYKEGFISSLRIREILKRIIKELSTLLYVGSYKFELTPKIGAYQVYSQQVSADEAIDNADRAANLANENQRYYIFDEKAEKLKQEDNRKEKDFNEYIVNLPKDISFVDIVSYIGGENIGLFPHLKNEETVYKNYYFYSLEHKKKKTLIYNTINTTLINYQELKTNQRLFIFMQFDSLDIFKQIMNNHEEYKQNKIVVVITDYKELLENTDKNREKLREILSLGVSLGIIADREMLVTMSGLMHMFKWLIIPSKLANLIADEKEYLTLKNLCLTAERMNLSVIAQNISKYEIAKILKDIGVDFISGSILSQEYGEYNSTRRISKLIEERTH